MPWSSTMTSITAGSCENTTNKKTNKKLSQPTQWNKPNSSQQKQKSTRTTSNQWTVKLVTIMCPHLLFNNNTSVSKSLIKISLHHIVLWWRNKSNCMRNIDWWWMTKQQMRSHRSNSLLRILSLKLKTYSHRYSRRIQLQAPKKITQATSKTQKQRTKNTSKIA